jgi:dGTPase
MKKYDEQMLLRARGALDAQEVNHLSRWAALNSSAIRRTNEQYSETEYRQNYSIDVDRILHAHAYARYIVKKPSFFT